MPPALSPPRPRRARRPLTWLFASLSRAHTASVMCEHMFASHAREPASPRSREPRELPAGLADRVRPVNPVAGRTLPVPLPLAPLFPGGVLRRGTTTTVSGPPGHGATTLALSLLAAASTAGSWCAAVGLPDPGVVAAAD